MTHEGTCTWTQDPDEDGLWLACFPEEGGRNAFCFEDGDPEDSGFKFCPYCGKPLAVRKETTR